MAKSAFCLLSIVIGAALIFNSGNLFGAEKPEILLELKFNKKAFKYGEPIGAKVGIANKSGRDLLLSRGFSTTDFFLQMRIIDPAGKLVIARQEKFHEEFPDAPPLPFVLHDKKPVRAVPCEVLKAGAKRIMKSEDIGDRYALDRPGEYSAKLQISVAIFEDEPCHTKNYEWLGVIESKIVHFYIEPVDNKRKTARWPFPARNLKLKKNGTKVRQSRELAADISSKQFFNGHPRPASFDPIGDKQIASTKLTPVISSNQKSFSIILTGGGGLPTADIKTPAQAADVPIDTAIEVDVSDMGTKKVVQMHILGTEVYNTLADDPSTAYPHTKRIDTGPSSFTLIYPYPQTDFANCQQVDVMVKTYKKKRPNNQNIYIFNFETVCPTANDADGDGISDEIENDLLHTDPLTKTLFVRPKRRVSLFGYEYWSGFITLFPWAGKPGFADVPPFRNAGIEISVIGDPANPYLPMRVFDYDPGIDPNHPPCDILEIAYQRDTDYCQFSLDDNEGHTHFTGTKWSWDTKGYTPYNSSSTHYIKYKYFTSLVYPFPLDNYVAEGTYDSIGIGKKPILSSAPCTYSQCWEFDHSSPMNLNEIDPVNGLPDGTVEFNEITFTSNAEITSVGTMGLKYTRNEVLKRTIAHEMGHALLAASENDHCNHQQCIMYHSVADWKLWDFGPPPSTGETCTHSPSPDPNNPNLKDIRAPGVVHNRVH
jgi:hypothetical protein